MMILFDLLRQKRREFGLRQVDVAVYLGFETKNGYWSVENGKTKLSAEHLARLCELYGVTVNFFIKSTVDESC